MFEKTCPLKRDNTKNKFGVLGLKFKGIKFKGLRPNLFMI
jgi:hypothetical protein